MKKRIARIADIVNNVTTKVTRAMDLARHIKNYPQLFVRLVKKDRGLFTVKLKDGTKFRIRTGYSSDHNIFREVFIERIYTPSENFEVKKGDTVIDVGAHIGFFSILASKRAGRVISIEPTEFNNSLLEANVKLNDLESRVSVVKKALGKSNEKRTIYVNKNSYHTGLNSFYKSIAGEEFEEKLIGTQVDCITLDRLFSDYEINACNFLKMDCEGAEYEILFNASDATLKKIDKIAISTHNVDKNNGKTLSEFLAKKGFEVWFAPSGHPLYAKRK